MSTSDDGWAPFDAVILTTVSLALVGVITGSTLVMSAKRSSHFILPLEDGAYPGGVIAVVSASIVLLGSLFVRTPAAMGVQALVSGLLFGLPAYASFLTSRRASWALETPSDDVFVGQNLFAVASGLVALATVVGIVKYQVLKRKARRTSRTSRSAR